MQGEKRANTKNYDSNYINKKKTKKPNRERNGEKRNEHLHSFNFLHIKKRVT